MERRTSSHPPPHKRLHRAHKRLGLFDIARQHDADVLGVRDRFARIAETIFARCANLLWGVPDPMCGMKGYASALYTRAGRFDRYKLIGSELAVRSVVAGCRTARMPIIVRDRLDAPRFGRLLNANYRILRAMCILMWLYPGRKVAS